MAHIVLRLESNNSSPVMATLEGHSGYFIEHALFGGKIAQITDFQGKCINLVIRRLKTYFEEENPDYTMKFKTEFLLKLIENACENRIYDMNLDDLEKFDRSELISGQFIERKTEDDPDYPEFLSWKPSKVDFHLKPGEFIDERECGSK
jgi:hypothetical protein